MSVWPIELVHEISVPDAYVHKPPLHTHADVVTCSAMLAV